MPSRNCHRLSLLLAQWPLRHRREFTSNCPQEAMNCHSSSRPAECKSPNPEPGASLQKLVRLYQRDYAPNLRAQLDYFRHLPSLADAIDCAARAVNSQGKRFSHQYRIPSVALSEAKSRLTAGTDSIASCSNFDVLHSLLSGYFTTVSGLGPLYLYDTTLRLGAYLNLAPTAVYLHAGTRTGVLALGLDASSEIIPVGAFRKPIQMLPACEIEDFLCIFAKHLDELHATKTR
jgi:hypothetical protein